MAANSAIIDIQETPTGQLQRVTTVLTLEGVDIDQALAVAQDIAAYPRIYPAFISCTDLEQKPDKRIVELIMRYQLYVFSFRIEAVCEVTTDDESFVQFTGISGKTEGFALRVEFKVKGNRLLLYVTTSFDIESLGTLIAAQVGHYPELEVALLSSLSLAFGRALKHHCQKRGAQNGA